MSGIEAAAAIVSIGSSIFTALTQGMLLQWPNRGLKKSKDVNKAFKQFLELHQHLSETISIMETTSFLSGYLNDPKLQQPLTTIIISIKNNLISQKKQDIDNINNSMEKESLQLLDHFCTVDPSIMKNDQDNDDNSISTKVKMNAATPTDWDNYFRNTKNRYNTIRKATEGTLTQLAKWI